MINKDTVVFNQPGPVWPGFPVHGTFWVLQ